MDDVVLVHTGGRSHDKLPHRLASQTPSAYANEGEEMSNVSDSFVILFKQTHNMWIVGDVFTITARSVCVCVLSPRVTRYHTKTHYNNNNNHVNTFEYETNLALPKA